jgi:hypothetical protein
LLDRNKFESKGNKTLKNLYVSGCDSSAEYESGGGDHGVGFPFSSSAGLVEEFGRSYR